MTDQLIMSMVESALAEVAGRTEGRDSEGRPVLTQRDIDRLGPDYIPMSPWWRICKTSRGAIAGRSWIAKAWARVTR